MKKLIFILFIFVFFWVLLQIYEATANETMTSRVIPYLNDAQTISFEKKKLLV